MALDFRLPPAQVYQPATFQERGVAVPFTSPMLAGARVRPGDRSCVEWVVPNPSGGRGAYILPWPSVRALFRPSVYDTSLSKRIAALPIISPATIRHAGIEMALQGLAGRQAQAAARAAVAHDEDQRLLTNFMLLVLLAEQSEPSGIGLMTTRRSLEFERRAKQVIVRVAPRFERTPQEIFAALAGLTDVFGPTGVAMSSTQARVPRLLEQLTEMHDELAVWAQEQADDAQVELAAIVTRYSDFIIQATDVTLAKTLSLTKEMPNLLRNWSKTPDRVQDLASRPEWLLDGWEHICLLWQSAGTPERRRAVITEMAQLVPVIPRETADYVNDIANRPEAAVGTQIHLNKDWRTGIAVLNLTARNERLRALST